MPDLPRGSAHVCIDAGPLIGYADAGQLPWLATWFPPGIAFTADVITKVELCKNLAAHPQNQQILREPWLKSVPVDEDNDVQFVVQLRALWGSEEGRDWGEAEVVALCRHYGWTAIIDDSRGRDACARFRINCVSSSTLLVAASAVGEISPYDAWELHQAVTARHDRPFFPREEEHEPNFKRAIDALRKQAELLEGDQWPHLLAEDGVDGVVWRFARRRVE